MFNFKKTYSINFLARYTPVKSIRSFLPFFIIILFFLFGIHNASALSLKEITAKIFFDVKQTDPMEDIIEKMQKDVNSTVEIDFSWPTKIYLLGEAQLRKGDLQEAKDTFEKLVRWAAGDHANDKYSARLGTSGLATIAYWRWLALIDQLGTAKKQVNDVITFGNMIRQTQIHFGMVNSKLLPALPFIEEDIARLVSHIAWKAGHNDKYDLFYEYISINSNGEMDADDDEIIKHMIEKGTTTVERLDLFKYRRQLSVMKSKTDREDAASKLKKLWENESVPNDVRAEAGLERVVFNRKSKKEKGNNVDILNAVMKLSNEKGLTAQQALIRRAKIQNSVAPRNPELFIADLELFLKKYPTSRYKDEALYQLATEYLATNLSRDRK